MNRSLSPCVRPYFPFVGSFLSLNEHITQIVLLVLASTLLTLFIKVATFIVTF